MTFLARRDFSTLQDRVNRIFRESFSPERPDEALTTSNFAPPVDVYEDEHNITLKIEVPGIDEKDINVSIENKGSPSAASAGSRRMRKRRTFNASSGCTEASPVRSRCPTLWIQNRSAPIMKRVC